MKSFSAIFLHYLRRRASQRNLKVLVQLLLVLGAMIVCYTVAFHYLMERKAASTAGITGVADFVISEASMGANTIFNLLHRSDILLLAEGLDTFKVTVPLSLAGKTVAQSAIREQTGCSVIGIHAGDGIQINPDPDATLAPGTEVILIGSAVSEQRFLDRYIQR